MKYLTASEMRVWQRCKRRWWLYVYRELKKDGPPKFNNALGIGNRVHDALAVYYTPEDPVDPLAWLARSRAKDLEAYPDQADDIVKECELAEIMLDGYMEWLAETGEDQALTVIEAERARMARLEPERDVMLLSKLDARVKHDVYGDRINLEHKTTTSLQQYLPELKLNPQFLTEHLVEYLALLEEGEDPGEARGVLVNMLKKVKRTARATPPFYARVVVHHSLEELRNHWRHVVAISDQIEDATRRLDAGESHHFVCPPTPTDDCHWSCEFFRVCHLVDGMDDHEALIQAEYSHGNPLERYEGLLGQNVES